MKMAACPNCGGCVPHSVGPRPRIYCSYKCRSRCAYTRHRPKRLAEQIERDRLFRLNHPTLKAAKRRREHMKNLYGISVDDYDAMMTKQGNVCAICGKICSSGKRLAVDHCHTTLVVRGLLCKKCNTGIGLFYDQPDLLQTAINYLSKST